MDTFPCLQTNRFSSIVKHRSFQLLAVSYPYMMISLENDHYSTHIVLSIAIEEMPILHNLTTTFEADAINFDETFSQNR